MTDFEQDVIAAAERGDRFAFTVAAERLGSLDEARALVRSSGVVRMVDRVARARALDRDDRIAPSRMALRSDNGDDTGGPVMFGHFAVFNEWTEIDSWFEGRFLEQIAPRAFRKTFRENRAQIRSIFQHGADPVAGDKPLGPIDDLREDEVGGYYEVPLLDAPYVRADILPGLREGIYGASFAFKVMRDEMDEEPDPSDANPNALPQRTLKEVRLYEFGPVTFPAYPSATAGVRAEADRADEEARADAPAQTDAGTPPTSGQARRTGRDYLREAEEVSAWRL